MTEVPPCPYCHGTLIATADRLECTKFAIHNFPLPVDDAA